MEISTGELPSHTHSCKEISHPLGDHQGQHDTETEGYVSSTLHDDDSQTDGCTEDAA